MITIILLTANVRKSDRMRSRTIENTQTKLFPVRSPNNLYNYGLNIIYLGLDIF